MKRTQKFAAASIIAALIGTGTPAMAAQNRHDVYNRAATQYRSADRARDREWNDNRNRDFSNDNRWARDRRDNDRHERDASHRDAHSYGYSYAPAPVYAGPVYGDGYYDRTDNGRTAAIIGGSAAAGALIGAAAGIALSMALGKAVFGVAAAPRLIVYPISVALTVIVAVLGAYPLRRLVNVRPATIFRGEA